MKNSLAAVSFILICTFSHSNISFAGEIAIETDPATFAFNGYAGHIRLQPSQSSWVIGLGIYAMKFPDVLQKMALDPAEENLSLKLNRGYGLFLDRYLSELKNQGLFIGLQLANHNWELETKGSTSEKSTFNTFLTMPRIGYRYNFSTKGFYLLPWVGVGFVSNIGEDIKLNGQTFKPKEILPFATLHLGYEF